MDLLDLPCPGTITVSQTSPLMPHSTYQCHKAISIAATEIMYVGWLMRLVLSPGILNHHGISLNCNILLLDLLQNTCKLTTTISVPLNYKVKPLPLTTNNNCSNLIMTVPTKDSTIMAFPFITYCFYVLWASGPSCISPSLVTLDAWHLYITVPPMKNFFLLLPFASFILVL